MSILKLKYKAHKLVNTIFYLLVFVVGFLLGFASEKIDYNKLISQVLMIDNVSAYTIYQDNNVKIDEEFIYNMFIENIDGFSLELTPYIRCEYSPSDKRLNCSAQSDLSSYYAVKKYSGYYYIANYAHEGRYVKLTYSITSNSITINNSDYSYRTISKTTYIFMILTNDSMKTYTNFDVSLISGVSSTFNSSINLLDFSDYSVNLEFNENLFKDNPDFKEVCVDKGKKYGITTTNIDPVSNTAFSSDFIWFPGKTTGVKYSEYDSLSDDNILIFNDEISTENYYFEDKDKIDSIYSDEIISNYFNHSGYTDKYSYYGYTAYKFMHSYYVDENDNQQNMFTIFDFSNINFSVFGSAGGSSSSFGDTPLTYCFYIKNEFNVTELKNNEWNDYVGVVPTPGGNLDVITTHNKNNVEEKTKPYFSVINDFISKIRPTINFINTHILELYNSMPLILRSFIISFLVLTLIRILIGMVVR